VVQVPEEGPVHVYLAEPREEQASG
jgi:hypothetical protein